jgi:hypothetical protein
VCDEQHLETATLDNGLAVNVNARGKYAEARPLYEKALASQRQALGSCDRFLRLGQRQRVEQRAAAEEGPAGEALGEDGAQRVRWIKRDRPSASLLQLA